MIHGRSANYTCDFRGYPFPTVVWTRNTSSNPITNLGRFSIHTFQVSENGSYLTRSVLEITSAIERLEGTFICLGSNNQTNGNIFSSTFSLDVVIPPQIILSPVAKLQMVATPTSRKRTIVMCVAFGSPRPSMEWTNGGRSLHNSSQVTITETVEKLRDGGTELVRSQLEVCGPETLPTTEYSCIATNHYNNTAASNSTTFQICTIGIYIWAHYYIWSLLMLYIYSTL